MYTVYHARHTRSLRVLWALEEVGADYDLVVMPFKGAEMQADAFRAISLFGAVPAIRIGEQTISESGAIVELILIRAGSPLRPTPDDPTFPTYLMWSHAGEATLTPPLAILARHTRLLADDKRSAQEAADALARWQGHLNVLNRHLQEKDFVTGARFTGADIMIGYALRLAELLGALDDPPTDVARYWKRLCERPAYQRALAV